MMQLCVVQIMLNLIDVNPDCILFQGEEFSGQNSLMRLCYVKMQCDGFLEQN